MSIVNINMLHTLKPFQCPSCNCPYSNRDVTRFHNVTRFPRIISCNHSVCESCLRTAAKNKTSYSCPECESHVNMPEGDASITKLPPDVHALGIISANMKNALPSIKVKMVPSSELKRNQSYEALKKSASVICGVCNKNEAQWQCDKCEQNFCGLCFDQVHNALKSMRKHEGKKIFAELYNSMVQEGCREHENKPVEFYCEIDNQLTCSYCMLMGDHVGHEVRTLMDKNKSCAEDIKQVLEDEFVKAQAQLKYTDHLLSEAIPKEKVDISEITKRIHDYFHKLHTMLQIRETDLVSELEEIAEQNVKKLQKMSLDVSNYQKDLAAIRKDAEAVIENPCLAISAPAILQKLNECQGLPCYLVPICDEQDRNFNVELNLDTELEEQIKKFGEVCFDVKPRFSLMTASELPETYNRDIPEEFNIKAQDTESCSTSVDTFSEDSLSVNSTDPLHSGIEASLKCRDFKKMQPEKVLVSHIQNLHSFFVQRCSDLRKLRSLSDAMDKWCRGHEAKKNIPVSAEIGDLYIVQFSGDKKWYRGRIKKIYEPEENEPLTIGKKSPIRSEDGKILVKSREPRVEVFYIDYGNTEIVPLSRLRNILARFLNPPGVAKECSLADLEPAQGKEWSDEAVKSFAKFVSNKELIMQVFEERNNVLLVDLSQVADNDICNDGPVSVRDAFVFMEYAVFPGGKTTSFKQKKNQRDYLPPESLKVNANICAIVSHVDSPSHLYVQQMSTAEYLSALIFEMNSTYDNEFNTLLNGICAPKIGMICAAQFSLDKQWYRAKIIGLPGGSKVEVQYVDFGNTEIIHHKYLRKLFDKFCKLNIQAIPCKLAHVTYNQEKSWSAEAKEWLTKKVSRKQLTLKSLGMIPGENKAEIVLYYTEDDVEICVNALMVEVGLASSCGPFSTEVRKKKQVSLPVTQLKNEPICLVTGSETEGPAIPPPKPAPEQKKHPTFVKPPPEENCIEVHVSHIENPGLFYIRLVGDTEKKLENLMSDLQKTYEGFDGELPECAEGKAYAVYSKIRKKWFRGTVLSKIPEDKLKVRFVDYGYTEEVEKGSLRKLLDKFTADEAFSVSCHIAAISPAGGSIQWPHSAKDLFIRLVTPHEKLLFSTKGELDCEKKSLPSDLFIENIIRGGALEPTKVEYKSVSSELINHGLALPIRKKKCCGESCEETTDNVTSEKCNGLSGKLTVVETNTDSSAIETKTEKCETTNEITESQASPLKLKQPSLKPRFRWKPPVPPADPNFKGYVTNIGEDGTIHLHVVCEKSSSIVDTIKKAVHYKYFKSEYEPPKQPLPIGEACMAKFSVDNLWYRAEVLSVYPGKLKVNFVDYGNNEIVSLSDVRTDIIMEAYARQCLECVLHGIKPDGADSWDSVLLDFLHNRLVEETVDVKVVAPADKNGRLHCEIITRCGINVAELLMNMGSAVSVDDCSFEQENEPVFRTFKPATELKEGGIYPVCITQVNTPNIVYLQLLKITDPKLDYEEEQNKEHVEFLQLIKDLRDKAGDFPNVKEPMPGLPCVAKYSYDNNWYRCEVTDLTEDGVVVLYVDYGNSEVVPLSNLREPESRFIDFPVQVHFCELHGVKAVGDDWDPQVKEYLVNKLLVSDKEIYARIVVPGKISKVELLTKSDEGELKLVYNELVEKNLITLDKVV